MVDENNNDLPGKGPAEPLAPLQIPKQKVSPTNLFWAKRIPGKIVSVKYRLSNFYLEKSEGFKHALLQEGDERTPFNWLPVVFGAGCFIYFKSPAEPFISVLVVTAILFMSLAWRQTFHNRVFLVFAVLATLFAGMSAAKLRTTYVATPVIERQITTKISGLILSISQNSRGSPRYLIRPISAENILTEALPKKIRLSSASSKQGEYQPGQIISGLARIYPFSGPAYPGGFDFFFNAWFKGIGGSGFFMGKPQKVEASGNLNNTAPTKYEQIHIWVNQLRGSIETRIHQAIPGEEGDIAVALITGNRTGLDRKTQDSLRQSGLAHILAISGLHMALVTLTIVWLVRTGLALFPTLVLRYSVHKWAAIAGFTAASSYLVISGAGIATQRAWIMISVMLLSTLMDRRAITMRSVAIAALIILVLAPESLLSPGFQMSFAAVAALVAAYEVWRKKAEQWRRNSISSSNSKLVSVFASLWKYVIGLGFTSLIAGGATALFSAYHFHQVAPMGLVANLGAMPVVSIAVMPLALFSILLMPYGLENLALTPLAAAVNLVVEVSDWVNGFQIPGVTGMISPAFLALGLASLLVLTLLKTRLRLFGVLLLLPLPFLANKAMPPDIIIAETGRAIAVKNGIGNLELLYPRRGKFVTDIWKKAWPDRTDNAPSTQSSNKQKRICDKEQCIVSLENGKTLHVVYKPALLEQACETADILIAPRLWWVNCRERMPELILKRHDFEQFGTHTIYFTANNPASTQTSAYHIERALPNKSRPWNRQVKEKL